MKIRISASLLLLAIFWGCRTQEPVVREEKKEVKEEQVPVADERLERQQEEKSRLNLKEYKLNEYRATRERHFDLLHTSLDLSFDFEQKHVLGKARVKLKPFFYDQSVVYLDAKDFEIHDISQANGEDEDIPLSFRYDGKEVMVYLPGKS